MWIFAKNQLWFQFKPTLVFYGFQIILPNVVYVKATVTLSSRCTQSSWALHSSHRKTSPCVSCLLVHPCTTRVNDRPLLIFFCQLVAFLWSGVGPRLLKPLGADKAELATKNEESSAGLCRPWLDRTPQNISSLPTRHFNECWKYTCLKKKNYVARALWSNISERSAHRSVD